MAILSRLLGAGRDMPQLEAFYAGSAAAASGNDYEHAILAIPDLTKLAIPTGAAGDLPTNNLYIRSLQLITEASVTGAATDNFALNFRQYRAGALLNIINASGPTLSSGSSVVITPNGGTGMANIQVGQILRISGGTGTAEYVIVSALTAGVSFTVPTLANNHSGAYAITCANLSTIYFNSGSVTTTAWTPIYSGTGSFTQILPNQFKAGDVLTLQRQTFGNGLTGGSPNLSAVVEWVSLYNNVPKG